LTRRAQPYKGLVVVSLALLIGCGFLGLSDPQDATQTSETYRNHYFGFEIALPKAWEVASHQTTEAITQTGLEMVAGDGPGGRAAASAALKNSYQLLTISKHPLGSPVDFNPMLMVMAEKVSHLPGVKSGKDYLFHMKSAVRASRLPLKADGEAVVADLGGSQFFRQIFLFDDPRMRATQSFNVAVRKGYALCFVATYKGQSQADELKWILSSVYFD
jgi:hypothetical protein